ncbi:hypothetical protein GCM10010236_36170 [Streptomyces eurythermus]|nr:hypothetical protein GCM10010236_36170 [Streptomyces eurythermus]
MASVYAVMIHWAAANDAPNVAISRGSATATIVASSTAINPPDARTIAARTSALVNLFAARAAGMVSSLMAPTLGIRP